MEGIKGHDPVFGKFFGRFMVVGPGSTDLKDCKALRKRVLLLSRYASGVISGACSPRLSQSKKLAHDHVDATC